MTWRCVLISHPARLSLHRRQMRIEQDDVITVPLEDLAVVVVEAREVVLTAPLLSMLAEFGITLLTCDEQFLPCGQWLPFAQHHRSLRILRLQLNQTEPQKKRLHQRVIQEKIRNQARVLALVGELEGFRRLRVLADDVQSGDRNRCESQAAALYFRMLFGREFARQQEIPINAALNYGYSIIRSAVARALVLYGFLPAIGLFHCNEQNAFNLADDLMEPYRPIVDLFVWSTYSEGKLPEQMNAYFKQNLIRLLHCLVLYENQHYSVLSAVDMTAASLQQALSVKAPSLLKLPEVIPFEEYVYE